MRRENLLTVLIIDADNIVNDTLEKSLYSGQNSLGLSFAIRRGWQSMIFDFSHLGEAHSFTSLLLSAWLQVLKSSRGTEHRGIKKWKYCCCCCTVYIFRFICTALMYCVHKWEVNKAHMLLDFLACTLLGKCIPICVLSGHEDEMKVKIWDWNCYEVMHTKIITISVEMKLWDRLIKVNSQWGRGMVLTDMDAVFKLCIQIQKNTIIA